MMDMILEHAPALAIAVPLTAAFATPLVAKAGGKIRNLWALAAVLVTEAIALILGRSVLTGGTRIYTLGATMPSFASPAGFPIRIILEVDAMSAFMAIISASIAAVVCIYSLKFMSKRSGLDKYYALLLVMTGGMLGLVTTGDIFSMFVFLELLSVASAGMIAFYSKRGKSAEAAFKYMVVSSIGALMILLAAGLLFSQYNVLNLAALAASIKFSALDKVALVLLFSAFAMKCGAVPIHMWVSDSYGEAPAPVSALLVVASQAGLYSLFRISFTLFGSVPVISTMGWAMVVLGVLSMFIGVTMALPQKDIKRLMAYHAVSQTGYMLLGVGVGLAVIGNAASLGAFGFDAMRGGIFHVLNHALYKGLLFLTAGAVIYRTGTKNLNEMGGLAHTMPLTTVFFAIGAMSIAGLPPFNGFASKFIIYESVFMFSPMLSVIAMLVSILTLASFVKVFHSAFMGPRRKELKSAREVPAAMLIAMGVLAILIVVLGFVPDLVLDNMVTPAANALIDQAGYIGEVLS